MLTTLVEKAFDSSEWLFEIKLDGFRAVSEINNKHIEIYSRNGISFKTRFPEISQHLEKIKHNVIFDGEIVALDEKGISRFQLLQNYEEGENFYTEINYKIGNLTRRRLEFEPGLPAPKQLNLKRLSDAGGFKVNSCQRRQKPIFEFISVCYYIFDILALDGKDLRQLPLIERKALLKKLLAKDPLIRYLDHIEDQGKTFYQLCKDRELEGVVGKRKESIYREGIRSREWVKIKIEKSQEVIICGFTEPKRSRKHFGSLIVGVYEGDELRYAGHVGGGFDTKQLKEIKSHFL